MRQATHHAPWPHRLAIYTHGDRLRLDPQPLKGPPRAGTSDPELSPALWNNIRDRPRLLRPDLDHRVSVALRLLNLNGARQQIHESPALPHNSIVLGDSTRATTRAASTA